MFVTKRSGDREAVDVNKIVRAVERHTDGLSEVDALRVATKTINGLYDGATTQELDELSIQTAAAMALEEPEYGKLAARLLASVIRKETKRLGVVSFSDSVELGHVLGLHNERLAEFVHANAAALDAAVDHQRDWEFEYFGMRTVYDRYLLRHPTERLVFERPQWMFMRVAAALSETVEEAVRLYGLFSNLEYLTGSPTLFNAGAVREQCSSCYLLDSPEDSLEGIYDRYKDIAMLSKFAGGIGVAYHRVRSEGSPIKGTNGYSSGIISFLKTLDSSVSSVTQGGRRRGAACVYLETWHPDIEDFLELRDNTGDQARRAYNLNLANWIPDLFMERVESKGTWSLFDPSVAGDLTDLWGDEFKARYEDLEARGLATRTVNAVDLYKKMLRTLAETGNGWMTWKDACNRKSNQTSVSGAVIHSSNLCSEILEVTSAGETSVCNLGSINLARHTMVDEYGNTQVDYNKLRKTVHTAVRQLDRVIDLNYYPIESAEASNKRWRPIGLGLMGLQDVFFQMGIPFGSDKARAISTKISERVYFHALCASSKLAQEKRPHQDFEHTRAAAKVLQQHLWDAPRDSMSVAPIRWEALRRRIQLDGLRNSLLIAIAPTATIATIAGCYECIEPQLSNLFKRETLSGDFIQVNKYLVQELKELGLWTPEMRSKLIHAEGSVQGITELPEDLREVYKTVWEMSMVPIIDMAAARGPFIDQSQSLNLFQESPKIDKLSAMYFYAWKKGLKTTYYLRSRPATRIAKATVDTPEAAAVDPALACSLENPGSCDACG